MLIVILGCCLVASVILTFVVPSLTAPERLSTFPSDILSEPGFEKVKNWDDPRLEAEIDRRQRLNTRNLGRSGLSTGFLRFFFVADVGLAAALGFLLYRRFTRTPLDARYEHGPPALPFPSPWSD